MKTLIAALIFTAITLIGINLHAEDDTVCWPTCKTEACLTELRACIDEYESFTDEWVTCVNKVAKKHGGKCVGR